MKLFPVNFTGCLENILNKLCLLTLSQTTDLNSSKLKQSADDNLKFNENSITFSKRVENSVGKGEIARYEPFLLSHFSFTHSVFIRHISQGHKKVSLCGNGFNTNAPATAISSKTVTLIFDLDI